VRSHIDHISNELYDHRVDFLKGTDEQKCPSCRNKNVVLTSTQSLEFNLICHNCGYHGPQLSLNEMRELL